MRIEALQAEQATLAQRRDEAQAAVTQQASRLAEAETLLRERREALEQAQQARREAEERLREAEKARAEIGRAHHQLQARRDALAQLEEQHASAPQATQRLLKFEVEENNGDLHGTLSSHIAVQAGYEAPLALLLGDAVNALVLNDDAAAQAWRDKLAGKEQCAFAPLQLRASDAAALERRDPRLAISSPPSRSSAESRRRVAGGRACGRGSRRRRGD